MQQTDELLKDVKLGADGIWGEISDYGRQEQEKLFRDSVADRHFSEYLLEISKHHSIPVMDSEVESFISLIPVGGVVLDIGGCWGWHWRHINQCRPDITVVIVDLIRENLMHAQGVLKDVLPKHKVFLVHGNACSLKFSDQSFDGVWSVQTTQHIPNFLSVCTETFRVLKKNGIYWDYGLNNAFLIRQVYNLFRKTYHLNGEVVGAFFLRRINRSVLESVTKTFKNEPNVRYSEILFTPELGLAFGGRDKSFLGRIDSFLSSKLKFWRLLARQCSFHVKKTID